MVETRKKSYSQVVEPKDFTPSEETLTERRKRWANLLPRQHYQPVISEILDEELPKYKNSTVINASDRISHMRECALILASASRVFTAAVEGNLVRRLLQDTDLQSEYALIQERAHIQPSIYIHLLTDALGTAPTPTQYLFIRSLILSYLSPACPHAHQIDNITPPFVSPSSSSSGHRKYLHTHARSPTRVATLHRFCTGIQHRFDSTPVAQQNTPFPHPPAECGYSLNAHRRLAQHRAHQSSNYIMNLVSDICTYLYRSGQFAQHFSMQGFVVYLIFRPRQAAIAEVLCSALMQVWIEKGGGFNAYPAGRSVWTAGRVSVGEWEGHERWVRERSCVLGNMRGVREGAEEWRRTIEWEGGGGGRGEI